MQKSFNFLFTYFTYNQKVQEIKTQLVNQLIYENVIDSTKLKAFILTKPSQSFKLTMVQIILYTGSCQCTDLVCHISCIHRGHDFGHHRCPIGGAYHCLHGYHGYVIWHVHLLEPVIVAERIHRKPLRYVSLNLQNYSKNYLLVFVLR